LLQVKARFAPATGRRGTRQLSTVRSWGFDLLAVVLFDDDYSVRQAALIPTEVAKDAATYVRHVNGYRVIATDELLAHPDVEDFTGSLRARQRESEPWHRWLRCTRCPPETRHRHHHKKSQLGCASPDKKTLPLSWRYAESSIDEVSATESTLPPVALRERGPTSLFRPKESRYSSTAASGTHARSIRQDRQRTESGGRRNSPPTSNETAATTESLRPPVGWCCASGSTRTRSTPLIECRLQFSVGVIE